MGGVAGHLAHLYDNRDLTYNKMAEILQKAASGELIGTEKTDGYNIYLGFVDGKPRAARNKGDMSRGGMTMGDLLKRKFKGGKKAKKAYVTAFKAYERAVNSLSDEEKTQIFGPAGEIFYNTEIQGPVAPNVVNYDENILNIHHMGHKKYNKENNQLELVDAEQSSVLLDQVVDRFEQATADELFSVRRTAFLELNRITDENLINSVLDRIQSTGYSGNMTINDYLESKLKPVIDKDFVELDEYKKQLLTDRILEKEGAAGIPQVSKGMPKEEKGKISQYVKDSKFILGKLIEPISLAIHDLTVELLKGLKSAYILDNRKEVERLKKETAEAIEKIKDYRGPEYETAHGILARQINKLKHHDNIDTVVEGFVFQYDGQMYKFTGNFAPMNQLLGLFKYGRGKIPKMVKEAVSEPKEADNSKRIIAIYPGRFQPMGRHHAEVFKKMQNEYGKENTFISTTDRVELPKSPFNFSEKSMIIGAHGIDPSNVVMTINPYTAKEITDSFDPETTVAVYFVGCKDMEADPETCEKPRFPEEILGGFTKKGTPRYFRKFDGEEDLKGYEEHAYVAVAPHVEIDIPDFGEMSGTTIRKALKDADEEAFKKIMKFYDPDIYDLIKSKLSNVQTEVTQHFLGIFRGLADEVLEERAENEKQRRWACAQAGKSRKKFKGKPSLTKTEAEKMCTDPLKEEEIEESSMSGGHVAIAAGPEPRLKRRRRNLEEEEVNEALNYILHKLGV